MDVIEVTLVGALVQIVLSGIFVSFCQCHRLWPLPPAGNRHKVFLVLYAFLYGILALSSIFIFGMMDQYDAEALISFTGIFFRTIYLAHTPIFCRNLNSYSNFHVCLYICSS